MSPGGMEKIFADFMKVDRVLKACLGRSSKIGTVPPAAPMNPTGRKDKDYRSRAGRATAALPATARLRKRATIFSRSKLGHKRHGWNGSAKHLREREREADYCTTRTPRASNWDDQLHSTNVKGLIMPFGRENGGDFRKARVDGFECAWGECPTCVDCRSSSNHGNLATELNHVHGEGCNDFMDVDALKWKYADKGRP